MNIKPTNLFLRLLGLLIVVSVISINFNYSAQAELPVDPDSESESQLVADGLRIVKVQTADGRYQDHKTSLEYVLIMNTGSGPANLKGLNLKIESAANTTPVTITLDGDQWLEPGKKMFFVNQRLLNPKDQLSSDPEMINYQSLISLINENQVLSINDSDSNKLINSRLTIKLSRYGNPVDQLVGVAEAPGVKEVPYVIKTGREVLARQVDEAGELIEPAIYEELLASDLAVDELPVACGPDSIRQNNQCLECGENEEIRDNQCLPCAGDQQLVNGKCQLICPSDQQLLDGQCQPVCAADQELVEQKCLAKCSLNASRKDGQCVCNSGYELNSKNLCVKKCEPGFKRDLVTGQCKITGCETGKEIGFTGTCVTKCRAGQVRNPETNRCRKLEQPKIATTTKTKNPLSLKPISCPPGKEIGFTGSCVTKCASGYTRNRQTNRCRKIASTVGCQLGYELSASGQCVKRCQLGYYRHPETGRCRKIASDQCEAGYEKGFTGTCVKKCEEGYSRDQETNRCKKDNKDQCKEGYEKGFTGSCVKKCEDGYERSRDTNRCRKVVEQVSDQDLDDMVGAVKTDDKQEVDLKLSAGQTVMALATASGILGVSKARLIKKFLFG